MLKIEINLRCPGSINWNKHKFVQKVAKKIITHFFRIKFRHKLCTLIDKTQLWNMCNTHNFKFLWDTIHSQTIYMVLSKKKMRKNHPMVPPLDDFQWKNRNCSSLARMISASRRSFFANLTTFERPSGLKKFSLLKIAILKMGWLSKFQSHRSWGDAHLS